MYATGEGTCPSDVAVTAAGTVYVVTGCDTDPRTLHTFDPATGTLSGPLEVGLVTAAGTQTLQLDNVPSRPNVVAATSGNWVDLLDLSASTPASLGTIDPISATAAVIAPDGHSVVIGTTSASAYRYSIAATPKPLGAAFATGPWFASGIAFDPSGAYTGIATYGQSTSYGPSNSLPLRTYSSSTGYDVYFGRGVAWLGTVMFALTTNVYADTVTLTAHTYAIQAPTTVTASGPSSATIGKALTITGRVTDRGTALAGAALTVTRHDPLGTTTIATAHSDANGNYTISNVPPNGTTNTYKVSYAADALHQSASATYSVFVTRLGTFLSVSTDKSDYYYNQVVHVTAHLGTTYTNRAVTIYAQQSGFSKVRIASGNVGPKGYLFGSVQVRRNTVYSAAFAGDVRHAPVVVTLLRKTHASSAMTLLNYYGTNSGGYRLYHKSQFPRQHAHVDPYKSGQCVYYDVQDYVSGKWHDLGFSDCFALDSKSNTDAYFDARDYGVVGRKYRSGFWYAGDRINEGQGSLWRYFTITS